MPYPSTYCKPDESAELLFWFWLLYHHAKSSESRLGIIRGAVQAGVMSKARGIALESAFGLDGE